MASARRYTKLFEEVNGHLQLGDPEDVSRKMEKLNRLTQADFSKDSIKNLAASFWRDRSVILESLRCVKYTQIEYVNSTSLYTIS